LEQSPFGARSPSSPTRAISSSPRSSRRARTEIFRDFEYVHHLEDPDRRLAALIFRASVNGRLVDGLDLLHFDDSDRIDELTVMLRPRSGVSAMADAMGKRFEELGLAAAPD
jgi:hypothetical protein